MAKSPTKPSTPRLSEVARHVVIPDGIVTTGWPAIVAKCGELGITFDEWQHGAGRIIFGKRADGTYAATVGGVVISIPRQVGKTFLVGSICIALCLLFPDTTVVWTAHRSRTATLTFRALQSMARRKKVAPFLKGIRIANGEQEIEFTNRSIIMFGARERGFGRGFDAVDVVVFDEAQILTEKALDDMVATMNQSHHPSGALLFYTGTPPKSGDPAEAFTTKRAKALKGQSRDMVYIETSADPDADPDDPEQWRKANPSYPQRTPHVSMLRLRDNLLSEESWRHEGLGIWDDDTYAGPFSPGAWTGCIAKQEPPKPECLGLALDVDRVWLSLAVASSSERKAVSSVMRVRYDRDGRSLMAQCKRIADEYGVPVAVDRHGPGETLIQELTDLGVDVLAGGLPDYIQACADIFDLVEAKELEHGEDAEMNNAVKSTGWRIVNSESGRRVWSRKGGDISTFEAATWALWGCNQTSGGWAVAL